jgi:hypothetical protein
MSGSVLFWNVSVHHLAGITTQRIVPGQGILISPDFRIGFTVFNITCTSESPLISQLLINNVTTEINGSTIHCSEDGDENNAPMTVITVIHKGVIIEYIVVIRGSEFNSALVLKFLSSLHF